MSVDNYYLGLDVGGTNIKVGLINDQGQVLARRSFLTLASRSPEEIIGDVVTNLREIAAQSPAPPLALGVGLPGCIDASRRYLVRAPNMPGWIRLPVADIMSEALGLPVQLENDTNLYALGEWLYGAGRGLTNLIVLTLGTGVGSGLILEGKLWYGAFDSAAEIGHVPLNLNGLQCGCGCRGCLETVASATGMTHLGRKLLAAGKPTTYKGRPEDLSARMLHELALSGDALAIDVFYQAGEALGQALSGIFNLLGLQGVVLGGGASGAFEFIQPGLLKVLNRYLIVTDPKNINVLPGILGSDAPLLGAAALLKQSL